jgi:hypothetical protein
LASGDTSSNYSVRATQITLEGFGSFSGTLNTWQALSSSRQWTVTQIGDGTSVWRLLMEIRYEPSGSVIASAEVHLTASVSS